MSNAEQNRVPTCAFFIYTDQSFIASLSLITQCNFPAFYGFIRVKPG